MRAVDFAMWKRLTPFLVLFGCATAQPPPDLVNARAAYARAADGPKGKAAPVELHKAKVALERAEQAFASDDTAATNDFAYVAQSKAELAEAVGATALSEAERQQAEADFDKKQGQLLAGANRELGQSREQLAESARTLAESARTQKAMATDLDAERIARAAADAKAAAAKVEAAAANEALAKLAAKEEQRGMVITLSGSVLFATNKADLLPGAQTRLDDVAGALMAAKERNVVIEGHTDSKGTQTGNLALSQRRAESVRSYLVSRGYPAEKILARGIGQERPIAENGTAEGRANNRRVEIVVERDTHSSLP